jgi:hypothetical protein
MRSLPLNQRLHLSLRLAPRALLTRRLQLTRSLLLNQRLHLAPRPLLRKKHLEVSISLVNSELPATCHVRPLEV